MWDKKAVTAHFDGLAKDWDSAYDRDVIQEILDAADIRPGVSVLDVACGTGALFTDYLNRGVGSITGVDISGGMIAQAEKKFSQPNVHLIRADILACRFDHPFDRCMALDALPYFTDHARLKRRLAGFVKPGGRLTIGQTLRRPDQPELGCTLPTAEALASMLTPWFSPEIRQNNSQWYLVCALRSDAVAPVVPLTDRR